MPRWKPRSLLILCVSFVLFLLAFNVGSLFLPPLRFAIPFDSSARGYELTVSNLTRRNYPLCVEPYPPSAAICYLTMICGSQATVYNKPITLSSPHFLNAFSTCDLIKLDVWPNQRGTGLWFRGVSMSTALIQVSRAVFVIVVVAVFLFLFRRGRHNSAMRSILIIQISAIFMLDPPHLVISYAPWIGKLHPLALCVGWWRGAAEIFEEYVPILRVQRAGLYKLFTAVPSVILWIATFSEEWSMFLFTAVISFFGTIGGLCLPVAAVYFFVTKEVTTQIHVVSGTVAMTVVYFINLLKALSAEIKDAPIADTIEVSIIGSYALFQTVFQFGEEGMEVRKEDMENADNEGPVKFEMAMDV
jgi:hypothetical protein